MQFVFPHKSHPVDEFELRLITSQATKWYKIGRDSVDRDEYWVQGDGLASEIGRFHSSDFGKLIEELTSEAGD